MWSSAGALPHLLFFSLHPEATPLPEGLSGEAIASQLSACPPRARLHHLRLWTLAEDELAGKTQSDAASDAEVRSVLENGSDLQRLRLIHALLLESTERGMAQAEVFNDSTGIDFLSIALPMLLMAADASQRRKYLRLLLESALVVEIFVTFARYYPATISEIVEEVMLADQAQSSGSSSLHTRNMHVLDRMAGVGLQAATLVRSTLTRLTHFPILCLKISLIDTKDVADYLDSLITEDMSMSSHWLLSSKTMIHPYGRGIVSALITEIQQISSHNGSNSSDSVGHATKCMRCLAVLAFFADLNETAVNSKSFSDVVQSMFQGGGGGHEEPYKSLYRHFICFLSSLLALLDSSSASNIQYSFQRALLIASSSNPEESFDPYFQFAFIIATMSMNTAGIEDIYCQILRVPHSFSKHFSSRSALLMKDAFQAISPIACINKVSDLFLSLNH